MTALTGIPPPSAPPPPGRSGPHRGRDHRPRGDARARTSRRSTSPPTTRCSPTCRARPARSTSRALELDSPALLALREAGVKLAVPLVSQGELIGVLNLGPRRSEQEYSSDDRKLLENLAAQAAPALRVGQLVREQQAEAATRQRFEQELEVARLIQQNFLPKQLPELPGWQVVGVLPAGARGGRRLLRRDPAARRPGRLRGRRRDRQGRPGRAGDGRDPQRAARVGPAAGRARRRARGRQRAPGARHAREDVRHLPVRRAGARDRPVRVRERRPRPALREDGRRVHGAAGPRACRSG